jgi:NitT/TauT family transport system ATP-binding protein
MAGMTAEEHFISLQNVRKVYRSKGTEFLAVSDVTMDVREGELVSLVGPSGCGKTTVLKILAGLHEADGGTIRIGNAKTPFDPARDIGMVFQQALLLKWRTILDNVLLPAEIAPAICSIWSASPVTKTSTRSNCPAACSNAPPLPAPLFTIPG